MHRRSLTVNDDPFRKTPKPYHNRASVVSTTSEFTFVERPSLDIPPKSPSRLSKLLSDSMDNLASRFSKHDSFKPDDRAVLVSGSIKALENLGVNAPTKSTKAMATLTGFKVTPITPAISHSFSDSASTLEDDSAEPRFSESTIRRPSVTSPLSQSFTASESSPSSKQFLRPRTSSIISSNSASTASTQKHAAAKEQKQDSPPPVPKIPISPVNGISNKQVRIAANTPIKSEPAQPAVASAYVVCGLPKDPSAWSLIEETNCINHVENAIPRWWKPEILGTLTSGQAGVTMDNLDSVRKSKASRLKRLPHAMNGEIEQLPKADVAQIQAKVMKMSLPRDVEIIASTVAPPSTIHAYSFEIVKEATEKGASASGAIASAFDLALANAARPTVQRASEVTRYHAVTLTVYQHADKARQDAIHRAIEAGNKAKTTAMKKAAKASAAGRKAVERIKAGTAKPNCRPLSATDTDTEAFYTESEWEGGQANTLQLPISMGSIPLWLPYSLTLVSRYPIYNLLTDYIRISWARFSLQISRHSLSMNRILNRQAVKPGHMLRLCCDPLSDKEDDGTFVTRFPGMITSFEKGSFADIDFPLWPIFKCLSADNILTICELALAPFGRIIFQSRHSLMLNLACETFRYILQHRGWSGISHSAVHARDIKIITEDPGQYLLGISSLCRPLLSNLPPEIVLVDLDSDTVSCDKPTPGALSKGNVRIKHVQKLQQAIGYNGPHQGAPVELQEAFYNTRFRPFSEVEMNRQVVTAERLGPDAKWNFEPTKVLVALDQILAYRPTFLGIFTRRKPRATLDPSSIHIQQIVRAHSTSFIDRRDMLESRLFRMNRRLAFLINESNSWGAQFQTFQTFAESLSKEAADLKKHLDHEKREAKRLSAVVAAQIGEQTKLQQEQQKMQDRLKETESARSKALEELNTMASVQAELEQQRDNLVSEIEMVTTARPDMLEAIMRRIEQVSEVGSISSSIRRAPSSSSMSSISNDEDDDESMGAAVMQRLAIAETMKAIQDRLEVVMQRTVSPVRQLASPTSAASIDSSRQAKTSIDSGTSNETDRASPTPSPSAKPLSAESRKHLRISAVPVAGGVPAYPEHLIKGRTSRSHPSRNGSLVSETRAERPNTGSSTTTTSARPNTGDSEATVSTFSPTPRRARKVSIVPIPQKSQYRTKSLSTATVVEGKI